ncbi:unnamed protein product [Tetraodon nigroviridis]|uniref:(spotted green pufferfish) hypothetical protein n=1 Tax=Tetraodon nigroviridis TaxID=99883 RepID=Q4REM7_TETNG|nr:unnamed protein product [Tetraodon nigroviridis]
MSGCCGVVDTVRHHARAGPPFCSLDRRLLSASVKCSEMSTGIYLNDADDTKLNSSQGNALTLICPGTVQPADRLQNTQQDHND